jgi:hypothetical protein
LRCWFVRNSDMKSTRKVSKLLIPALLFFIVTFGCSGTLQSSAKVTLLKVPFGQGGNTSKNTAAGENAIADDLPKKLGGLNLTRVIQDKEATVIINRMHGRTLDDCENIIAYYGSKDAKNILYVSVYENPEKAKTSLMKMAMKMAAGSTVFKPLTRSKMGAGVHFETEGMGYKHYFYRVDNILIWWQVEPDMAAATFQDLLKFDFTDLNGRKNK